MNGSKLSSPEDIRALPDFYKINEDTPTDEYFENLLISLRTLKIFTI